ncbi:hypothetical protein ACVQ92_09110 [Staphylococcus aureus]
MSASLPRVRDFQGVSKKAFDGRGNYTLGVKEQLIFPEIDYDKVSKVRRNGYCYRKNDCYTMRSCVLLANFGMPFRK